MAASATIRVKGDTKDFQKAMKGVEKTTEGLQKTLSNIATKASIAFAGLSATVTSLIKTYRVQEQAEVKLATALKSTGSAAGLTKEELLNMASGLQQVTTFGDEAIIGAQSLLLTFTSIGRDVFPMATETILDMSAAMGQDLKSSTVMLGKALNDPVAGIAALSRVGVQLSQSQKDLIKSFADVNNIAGAQKVILGELQVQFGGQARATAEGTGRFIQLSNTIGDLAEKIGKHLVPPLAEVAKFLNEAFGNLLKDKNETLAKTVAQVILFTTNLAALTTVMAISTKAIIAFRGAMLSTAMAGATLNKVLKASVAGLALFLGAAAMTKFMDNFTANMKKATKILKSFGMALVIGKLMKKIPTIIANAMLGAIGESKKGLIALKADLVTHKDWVIGNFKGLKDEIFKVEEEKNEGLRVKALSAQEQELADLAMAYERQMEMRAEFNALLLEKMGEEFAEKMELTGENDEIFATYNQEQRAKLLEDLSQFQLTKNKLEQNDLKERLKRDIKEKNDELKYEHQHKVKLIGMQKLYYKTMKFLDSQRLKDAGSFASQFNQMATSSNKELRAIAKIAANVQIVANTAAAASSAMSQSMAFFGPIAGPVIGATLAAAQIAFGAEQLHKLNAQKLADGGIVEGGLQGLDSVPAMLMPGELVVPKRNAEDALNAIGASRDEEIFGAAEGGAQEIIIGFDGEEASQVLTAKQIENQALGISREEVA